jgi:hypothetical protein
MTCGNLKNINNQRNVRFLLNPLTQNLKRIALSDI